VSRTDTNNKRKGLWPSVVILSFILGYLIVGYMTLDATTRLVPLLAGVVTLLLLILDMLQIVFRGGTVTVPELAEGGGVKVPESRGRELTAIAFVAAGVAAIYLLGFVVAIPLYLYASIAYLGQQSIKVSASVAILTSLAIYLVFELALDYQLFPGVLFY
jgi:hypothetical protein